MKTKIAIITIVSTSLLYFNTINRKYNDISNKLDVIIKVTDEENIDSLYQEIMDIGWKYDSMTLKYEHGWEF